MQRRTFLSAAAALAAPRIARAAGTTTLKFLPLADLNSLAPHITGSDVLAGHSAAVYDMLYSHDESFTPRRQMVEGETTSADGKLWQFTLRPGLRFHDGEPVLARDVVASLRRWAILDAFGKTLMDATDELSAASDRVVQFRLKKPFPRLIQALAKFSSPGPFIIPERQAVLGINTPIIDVIGSGPFRFRADERVLGSRIVYDRFDRYLPRADGVQSFQAAPKIASFDRVEWTIIPDASTAAAALIKGEVDW